MSFKNHCLRPCFAPQPCTHTLEEHEMSRRCGGWMARAGSGTTAVFTLSETTKADVFAAPAVYVVSGLCHMQVATRTILRVSATTYLLLDCCLALVGSSSSSSVSSSLSEYSMSLISPPTLPTHDRCNASRWARPQHLLPLSCSQCTFGQISASSVFGEKKS